jgi:oligopeptidase A
VCFRSFLIICIVSENPAQNVFADVLDPLEKHGAPLDTTWGLVKTLYLTKKDLMPVRVYVNIHDKARRSRALKFNSEPIYTACKVKYFS